MKIKLFAITPFLFLFTAITWAQDNLLTPLDIARIQSISAPVISSDGKLAAYRLNVPADPLKENKLPENHLYIVDIATGKSTALVTNRSISTPAFRPGTTSITYLSKNSETKLISLFEISARGGDQKLLYSHTTSIKSYDWAADGETLAYTATQSIDKPASMAPYKPEIYEEDRIFTRAYVVKMGNEKAKQVDLEGSIYSVLWSPDGKKLAMTAAPTPLVDDSYVNKQIYFIDGETLEMTAKVDHQAKLGSFAWSPDGTQIVMIAGAHINDPISGRIFTVSADGGRPLPLMEGFEGMFHQADWVKKNILNVLTSIGTKSEYRTINLNSSKTTIFVSPDNAEVWTSFDRAGNITIFRAHSPSHPYEVYVAKGFNGTSRLTNSNPWLDDKTLAKQELITYKARDGEQIEGLLIRPLGEQSGKKYPLITVVHGGPESHYDNGWITSYSNPGQVGAANGYAVFYPNYRGSTGRGIAYAMSSQADQAGKEFDDIVDGVDYLIESGLVDKDKVGVTGGSYGGFATAWMATRYSDRFAAGVMFVGISDHISKWGTSDIPEEMYHVHARSRVWDDYQDWLKRSPIYYVDQAKTPLLIMHGKEDTRVNPGQSMELYRHIKTRTDTPVRLVLYPGEGHGNRKSTARLDYNLRLLRWFNYYLKEEKEDLDTEIKLDSR